MEPDLFNNSDPRQIQVLISSDPLAVIPALQQSLPQGKPGRLTTLIWQALPPHEVLLKDVLRQMATLALAVWPTWYTSRLTSTNNQSPTVEQLLGLDPALHELQQQLPRFSLPWLNQAAARAARGSPPLIPSYSRTIQCEQLAMALDLSDGIILMALSSPHQSDDRLRSLAQVCGWLAQAAKTRVFVVMPPELASSSALDTITYQAAELITLEGSAPVDGGTDEAPYKLWPIHGQPHPFSPGEQRLAARLAADQELAGLFKFNQLVKTVLGSCYLVDLLWAEGKLVVEVDGYQHHSNPLAFCQDRQRDYELLISGYLVLRLPHSEVIARIEAAIAKIRHTVLFRRQELGV